MIISLLVEPVAYYYGSRVLFQHVLIIFHTPLHGAAICIKFLHGLSNTAVLRKLGDCIFTTFRTKCGYSVGGASYLPSQNPRQELPQPLDSVNIAAAF